MRSGKDLLKADKQQIEFSLKLALYQDEIRDILSGKKQNAQKSRFQQQSST